MGRTLRYDVMGRMVHDQGRSSYSTLTHIPYVAFRSEWNLDR